MAETDLTKMTSKELVEALIADNSLAPEFDNLGLWSKIDSTDWVNILNTQPKFAEKCDKWETFNSMDWRDIKDSVKNQLWIYYPPEAVSRIKRNHHDSKKCKCFNYFKLEDWYHLLLEHPHLANECNKWDFTNDDLNNLVKKHSSLWVYFPSKAINEIIEDPENANECKCWDRFTSKDWCNLLLAKPLFADKCTEYKGWNKFNSWDWCSLLPTHPEFAENCNIWSRFHHEGWINILKVQPQFEDKCDKWHFFNPQNWCTLLLAQPQFADKCTEYKGWKKFDSWKWNNLLQHQEQFWIYCPRESVNKIKEDPTKAEECKCWDWFSADNWSNLLLARPQFADKCKKWDTFQDVKWTHLLSTQPQLWKYCVRKSLETIKNNPNEAGECKCWDRFTSEDWSNLLSAQPQLWIYCPRESVKKIIEDPIKAEECKCWDWFSADNWSILLSAQPQFADKKVKSKTFPTLAGDGKIKRIRLNKNNPCKDTIERTSSAKKTPNHSIKILPPKKIVTSPPIEIKSTTSNVSKKEDPLISQEIRKPENKITTAKQKRPLLKVAFWIILVIILYILFL